MKKLTGSKMEYEEFLYPAVAAGHSENYKEAILADKVLTILDTLGDPPKLKPDGTPEGHPWPRMRQLGFELELEDAHAELIHKRLVAILPTMQSWRARQMLGLIDQLSKED